MSNPTPSADLIRAFFASLPSQFKNLHHQALDDLKPRLEAWLGSLNLVTRTEFDAQIKVLEHAQEELSELKQILKQLEAEKSMTLNHPDYLP